MKPESLKILGSSNYIHNWNFPFYDPYERYWYNKIIRAMKEQIEIVDILGETVFTSSAHAGMNEFEIVLPQGNYFVRAKTKNSITTSKLLITE